MADLLEPEFKPEILVIKEWLPYVRQEKNDAMRRRRRTNGNRRRGWEEEAALFSGLELLLLTASARGKSTISGYCPFDDMETGYANDA